MIGGPHFLKSWEEAVLLSTIQLMSLTLYANSQRICEACIWATEWGSCPSSWDLWVSLAKSIELGRLLEVISFNEVASGRCWEVILMFQAMRMVLHFGELQEGKAGLYYLWMHSITSTTVAQPTSAQLFFPLKEKEKSWIQEKFNFFFSGHGRID